MEGFNQVTLIGTVGKDAELKIFAEDKKVANFSLATNRTYRSGDEKKTATEWHNIEVWGELAAFAGNYVKKSKNLLIQGELRSETFENKDGQKVTRWKIAAKTINLLPSAVRTNEGEVKGEENTSTAPATNSSVPANKAAEQVNSYVGSDAFSDVADDLPF